MELGDSHLNGRVIKKVVLQGHCRRVLRATDETLPLAIHGA